MCDIETVLRTCFVADAQYTRSKVQGLAHSQLSYVIVDLQCRHACNQHTADHLSTKYK
jgi:hypothetical protein